MARADARAGVVDDEAAAAAEVSAAHVLAVRARAAGPTASSGCWIAPRRRGVVANRADGRAVEAIAALRRLRFTGAGARRAARACRSRRCRGSSTRSGWARSAGSAWSPPQRYERERPGELFLIDVKKLGRIQGGAGQTRDRPPRTTTPRAAPTRWASAAAPSAGTTCTSPSTTPLAWPTPKCCADEKATHRDRVPAPGASRSIDRHGITVERVLIDNGSRLPLHHPRRSPAARSASGTSAPGPAARRPSARPSASSAPCSAAGPRRDLRHQPSTPRGP